MDITAAAHELASWTIIESQAFFESFSRNGRAWAKIAADVQTKSVEKVQLYFQLLLHLIQHALGPLDIAMDFEDSRDSFLALITYYGVLCDSGLTAFTPAFNEVLRDRVKKQKLALSKLKEEKKLATEGKVKHEKLKLTLLPRSPLLEGHLRSAHLTPFLKLTLNSGKPLSTVVKHIASKWGVLTAKDSGTPFVGGQWRLYPNGHVHAGWGDADDKPNVHEVYEALHRPAEFTLLYDCTSKAPIRPTLISSVPLTKSGTIPQFISPLKTANYSTTAPTAPTVSAPEAAPSPPSHPTTLPLFAISSPTARVASTAQPKSSAKKNSKKPVYFSNKCHVNPKISNNSLAKEVREVDSKGNLYGAFAVNKKSPASPMGGLVMPDTDIAPLDLKADEDLFPIDSFLETLPKEDSNNHFVNLDPIQHQVGSEPRQDAEQPLINEGLLASDLEALNEISLSSLLLHPFESTQHHLSMTSPARDKENAPVNQSNLSLFQKAVAAQSPTNKSATTPSDHREEDPTQDLANQRLYSNSLSKPASEFSLPMIGLGDDSNFGGLFGLEDSMKFPSVSQMGLNDFGGWNFSNSGENGGLGDFQSPLTSPKKRAFAGAFDSSAFENDFNGLVENNDFIPFTQPSHDQIMKSPSKHTAKKPRRR